MRKILFTTTTCPNCPPAKAALEGFNDIEFLDAHENIELAQNFGIRAVPTLVIADGDDAKETYIGADEIRKYADNQ